jgi:hypothetical protein
MAGGRRAGGAGRDAHECRTLLPPEQHRHRCNG